MFHCNCTHFQPSIVIHLWSVPWPPPFEKVCCILVPSRVLQSSPRTWTGPMVGPGNILGALGGINISSGGGGARMQLYIKLKKRPESTHKPSLNPKTMMRNDEIMARICDMEEKKETSSFFWFCTQFLMFTFLCCSLPNQTNVYELWAQHSCAWMF